MVAFAYWLHYSEDWGRGILWVQELKAEVGTWGFICLKVNQSINQLLIRKYDKPMMICIDFTYFKSSLIVSDPLANCRDAGKKR